MEIIFGRVTWYFTDEISRKRIEELVGFFIEMGYFEVMFTKF